MRIVFVAWQGSEHTARWAGFFAERGHDVHVVTCGVADAEGVTKPATYPIHDLGLPRLGKIGYLLKVPRARRLIRSLEPDVVHAHHATSYGLLAAAAGARPLVVTSHGSDVLRSGRKALMRALLRRVLDSADVVTAPAEHVADGIRAIGTKTEVVVFQYGVEVERLHAVATAVRGDGEDRPDVVRVVSARGLDALYHTDDVIRAVAILRDRGVECVFDVAGRGSEEEALKRLVREIGVADRVTFHGHVPERRSEELIASAHVYASVADSDGVSIALFEAMALGPIPLLSDIRANRLWVRDGENGLLVDIAPDAIADGIERALELDPADVRRRNLEIVRERGDRETNLVACETMLAELVASARGASAAAR
jgi:L-malate glycosyltransferase